MNGPSPLPAISPLPLITLPVPDIRRVPEGGFFSFPFIPPSPDPYTLGIFEITKDAEGIRQAIVNDLNASLFDATVDAGSIAAKINGKLEQRIRSIESKVNEITEAVAIQYANQRLLGPDAPSFKSSQASSPELPSEIVVEPQTIIIQSQSTPPIFYPGEVPEQHQSVGGFPFGESITIPGQSVTIPAQSFTHNPDGTIDIPERTIAEGPGNVDDPGEFTIPNTATKITTTGYPWRIYIPRQRVSGGTVGGSFGVTPRIEMVIESGSTSTFTIPSAPLNFPLVPVPGLGPQTIGTPPIPIVIPTQTFTLPQSVGIDTPTIPLPGDPQWIQATTPGVQQTTPGFSQRIPLAGQPETARQPESQHSQKQRQEEKEKNKEREKRYKEESEKSRDSYGKLVFRSPGIIELSRLSADIVGGVIGEPPVVPPVDEPDLDPDEPDGNGGETGPDKPSDPSGEGQVVTNTSDGIGATTTPNCKWYGLVQCNLETGEKTCHGCVCVEPSFLQSQALPKGYSQIGPYNSQSDCNRGCDDYVCEGAKPKKCISQPGEKADTEMWYRHRKSMADQYWSFCLPPDHTEDTTSDEWQNTYGYCGTYTASECKRRVDEANANPDAAPQCEACPSPPCHDGKWYRVVCVDECYTIRRDECVCCSKAPKGRSNVCIFGPYSSETECKSKALTICDLLECVGESVKPANGQQPDDTVPGGNGSGTDDTSDGNYAAVTKMPEDISSCPVL